jgi:hypothetical protein
MRKTFDIVHFNLQKSFTFAASVYHDFVTDGFRFSCNIKPQRHWHIGMFEYTVFHTTIFIPHYNFPLYRILRAHI